MASEPLLSILEDIAPGVQRLWTADRRIVVFRLSNSSKSAMDAWTDIIKQTLILPDFPNLWIYHFVMIPLAGFFDFSTYLQLKFDELTTAVKNLPVDNDRQQYIAALLPGKFVPVARLIASVQQLTMPQNASIEIFSTLEDAVRWLDSKGPISTSRP